MLTVKMSMLLSTYVLVLKVFPPIFGEESSRDTVCLYVGKHHVCCFIEVLDCLPREKMIPAPVR